MDFNEFCKRIDNLSTLSVGHFVEQILKEQKCLTSAQTMELFKRYEKDKENNIPIEESCARTILILANAKLAIKEANRFLISGYDCDDKLSVANVALIKAVDLFDYKSNSSFSTYAYTAIQNNLRCVLRDTMRKGKLELNKKSFNETIFKDEDLTLEDTLGELDGHYDSVDDRDVINSFLKYFNPIQQYIIIASAGIYGISKTQRELAQELHVSQPNVSRTITAINQKLKIIAANSENLTGEGIALKKYLTEKIYPVLSQKMVINFNLEKAKEKYGIHEGISCFIHKGTKQKNQIYQTAEQNTITDI